MIIMEGNIGRKECRSLKFSIGRLRLDFNPVVTVISAFLIWLFISICMSYPNTMHGYMDSCKKWLALNLSWFYIGCINCWLVFLVVVYFSKYGDIKLGKDEDEPEFNDATYFTMLFAAGIGVGFFYFGVSEPVYHYEPGKEYGNRFWGRYSDNQRSQDAINMTLHHWGFHGWIVYSVVGLALGLMSHRRGLPMTIRSCFYPILGDGIFGFAGDIIDIISIISTMFGICASLAAGAQTMNSGIRQIIESFEETVANQLIIIWVITIFATISVVSGIRLGIRRLSELCFALGIFIMLCILFYDHTFHLLNLFVQSIGYYFQYLIQLGAHTDAFAQAGNAPDGKQNPNWMYNWTIAYWGWWIAWSPFVGMFIAKISRGRSVKNFIQSTMILPVVFALIWFVIVGGAGLNMEREAANMNINCSSPLGGRDSIQSANGLFRLSCRSHSQMYFDLIQQYGNGVGRFLRVISMISIVLYFVTSSDSGSLVIDCLSANGSPDPPVIQRIFWALTEGATASAIISLGGEQSIDTVLAAGVTSGLPFIPVICLLCVSIWKVLKEEHCGRSDTKSFSVACLEVFLVCSWQNVYRFSLACVVPWKQLGFVNKVVLRESSWYYMLITTLLLYIGILLGILDCAGVGLGRIGLVLFLAYTFYVASVRRSVRQHFQIHGSIAQDLVVSVFYPFSIYQMEKHICIDEKQNKDDSSENSAHEKVVVSQRNEEENSILSRDIELADNCV